MEGEDGARSGGVHQAAKFSAWEFRLRRYIPGYSRSSSSKFWVDSEDQPVHGVKERRKERGGSRADRMMYSQAHVRLWFRQGFTPSAFSLDSLQTFRFSRFTIGISHDITPIYTQNTALELFTLQILPAVLAGWRLGLGARQLPTTVLATSTPTLSALSHSIPDLRAHFFKSALRVYLTQRFQVAP